MVTPSTPDVEPGAASQDSNSVAALGADEPAPADVATPEAALPETATDETATDETATDETATDETATAKAAPAEVEIAETVGPVGPVDELPKPRRLLYVTLPGLWGALVASCLSFTPSLLPRS